VRATLIVAFSIASCLFSGEAVSQQQDPLKLVSDDHGEVVCREFFAAVRVNIARQIDGMVWWGKMLFELLIRRRGLT